LIKTENIIRQTVYTMPYKVF